MLTQERVRELFDYREDGELIWRVRLTNRTKVGDMVGAFTRHGYRRTSVYGEKYLVHKLVYLYHHGYIPESDIDHADGDAANNRIENLREVSKSCNMRNIGVREGNSSGVTGVSWSHRYSKWVAQTGLSGTKYLGRYNCFTEAVAHRLAAEQCLDWPNCNSSTTAYLYMQKYLKERSNDANRISTSTSEVTATHQSTEDIPSRGHQQPGDQN